MGPGETCAEALGGRASAVMLVELPRDGRALVALGVDLGRVATFATLQDGRAPRAGRARAAPSAVRARSPHRRSRPAPAIPMHYMLQFYETPEERTRSSSCAAGPAHSIYRTALMADVATGGPPHTGTRIAGILQILEIAE